jgi:hypothetical protein
VRDEVNAVIARYVDERRVDPSKRPAGALPVEFVNFAYPRLDLAASLSAEEGDGTDPAGDRDADDIDEDDELDEADIPG